MEKSLLTFWSDIYQTVINFPYIFKIGEIQSPVTSQSTSKQHCFSWSCSKFQCLRISHRTVCSCYVMKVGNFQCKCHQLDLTEHFSFMIAPNKKPKQNSSIFYHKTTFTAGTRLAFTDEPPSAKRHFLRRVSINLLYSQLTCFHTASGMILVEIEHQQLFWQSLS